MNGENKKINDFSVLGDYFGSDDRAKALEIVTNAGSDGAHLFLACFICRDPVVFNLALRHSNIDPRNEARIRKLAL